MDPGSNVGDIDLRNALAGMSPEDRALIALRYVAGFDSTELAHALHMSPSGPGLDWPGCLAAFDRSLAMDDMTGFEDRFEERLRAFARTGVKSVDSAAVARAVASSHRRSAATRPAVGPLGRGFDRTHPRPAIGPWRTRSMFKPSLAVAAVVAVLIVGALVTTRRDQPDYRRSESKHSRLRGPNLGTQQRNGAGPVRGLG